VDKQALKNLTSAHSWLGLIISTVLFIVFLAGSFSFFLSDLDQWEHGAHFPNKNADHFISAQQVIIKNLTGKNIDAKESVWLRMATDQVPYHDLMYSYIDPKGNSQSPDPIMHAVSGDYIYDYADLSLGSFFRTLHINLFVPVIGKYLVGLVTLFFFVALITGVLIHWRKIFNNLFLFRTIRTRDKQLDSHNIIGVMGLPFHLLYAVTGVIFNLAIIFEGVNLVTLFDGNDVALEEATRYTSKIIPPSGNFMAMDGDDISIDFYLRKSEKDILGFTAKTLEIEGWENDNAKIKFEGHIQGDFAKTSIIQYHMQSGKISYQNLDFDNTYRNGESTMDKLHYGDFAGYPLKIVFFLLGLGTCYVIISGNLLWITAQQKKRQHSAFALKLVKSLSSSVFTGGFVAISLSFILTRLLPISITDKSELICIAFYLIILVCFIYSWLVKDQFRVMSNILKMASFCFILVPILDWLLLSQGILTMLNYQRYSLVIVQSLCLVTGFLCWFMAKELSQKGQKTLIVK